MNKLNQIYFYVFKPAYRNSLKLSRELSSKGFKNTLVDPGVGGSVYLLKVVADDYLSTLTVQSFDPNIVSNVNPNLQSSVRKELSDVIESFSKSYHLSLNSVSLNRTPYSENSFLFNSPKEKPSASSILYQNF